MLRPRAFAVGKILDAIHYINRRATIIIRKENISLGEKEKAISLKWVSLEKLFQNNVEYNHKKVQGFAEIVDFLGKEALLGMARMNAIDFLKYPHVELEGEFD